jgi:phycocyanobilin lyase alpha subunit
MPEVQAMQSSAEALTDNEAMVKQTIQNLRQAEDPSVRYYAAWWIGKFRVRTPEAIAALLAALRDPNDLQEDGSYPLRRNAARALGKLKHLSAVQPLIDCLRCNDYYVREAAVQSLGELGDRASLSSLVALLDGGVEAAIPIPGKPHLPQPYDSIFETLGYLGEASVLPLIKPFLNHEVARVRMSAARALYQLTQDDTYADQIVSFLEAPELAVRRSALLDLGVIGYLPAAEPISQTLAENSIKLIALRGVLQRQVAAQSLSHEPLSEAAVWVMQLMDALL